MFDFLDWLLGLAYSPVYATPEGLAIPPEDDGLSPLVMLFGASGSRGRYSTKGGAKTLASGGAMAADKAKQFDGLRKAAAGGDSEARKKMNSMLTEAQRARVQAKQGGKPAGGGAATATPQPAGPQARQTPPRERVTRSRGAGKARLERQRAAQAPKATPAATPPARPAAQSARPKPAQMSKSAISADRRIAAMERRRSSLPSGSSARAALSQRIARERAKTSDRGGAGPVPQGFKGFSKLSKTDQSKARFAAKRLKSPRSTPEQRRIAQETLDALGRK